MTWLGSDTHWGVLVVLLLFGVMNLSGGPHRHRHVSHRKLRAAVPTSAAARTASVDLVDVEAGPRPDLIRPDAGTTRRANNGGADTHARGRRTPGPTAQTGRPSAGGLGPQQPVTVGFPDSAVTGPQLPVPTQVDWGPHPRDEEAGATCPRQVAPAA